MLLGWSLIQLIFVVIFNYMICSYLQEISKTELSQIFKLKHACLLVSSFDLNFEGSDGDVAPSANHQLIHSAGLSRQIFVMMESGSVC